MERDFQRRRRRRRVRATGTVLKEEIETGNHEIQQKSPTLYERVESVFERVLVGEEVDFYAPKASVSRMFEIIAKHLMADIPGREWHWYDGVVNLRPHYRKTRQIEFRGEMWVGDGKAQWKEDFRARVTDKRLTKQGLCITLWIGTDKAEADLASI